MSTSTTNIGLTKPASSEKVNLATLNANWDKIDTAIGAIGTPSASNNIKYLLDNLAVCGKTSSASSIDSITSPGTYWLASATQTTGWPATETSVDRWAILVVFVTGNNCVLQYLTMYSSGGANNQYIRMYTNAQWYAWRRIVTGPALTLEYGTSIASNSNLNDYTDPGVYRVTQASVAATITNTPTTASGYILIVTRGPISNFPAMQIAIQSSGNLIYIRSLYGTTWNSWYKYTGTAQ